VRRSSTRGSSLRRGLWLSLPVAMAVVGGLLLAEGAVRLIVDEGALPSPEPLLWHRPEVETKIRQMQALQADAPIDLMFVGSSVAYTGINPDVFDSEFRALTGRSVVSYNAGLAALSVSMVDAFVEEVFSRYATPKAMILLLSPRDVNRNNSYNQLMIEEVLSSAYGRAWLTTGVEAALAGFLLEHSQLYRYRGWIVLAALNGLRVPRVLPRAYDDPNFDSRGYVANRGRLTEHLAGGAASGQEVAAVSFRAFDPSGQESSALGKLIRYCRAAGIRLVILNMPMNRYLVASFEHPADDIVTYMNTLTALTNQYRVPLWDANALPADSAFADDEFSDVFHLNVTGADKLTRLAATWYAQLDGQPPSD